MAFMVACAWRGGAAPNLARTTKLSMGYEATEAYAQQQRDAYFAMMPSKALPKVSLDLRAWADATNDATEAGVFARQEGTVPKFKNVGTVSAESAAELTLSVAAQRIRAPLTPRWWPPPPPPPHPHSDHGLAAGGSHRALGVRGV